MVSVGTAGTEFELFGCTPMSIVDPKCMSLIALLRSDADEDEFLPSLLALCFASPGRVSGWVWDSRHEARRRSAGDSHRTLPNRSQKQL